MVNHLKGLGKEFKVEELNLKILKSLNTTWQLKVTTIFHSKDLTSITHAKLFEKLREYKMDMTRMAEEGAKEKKSRGLALKSSIPSSDEENAKGSDNENLTLLVRKFVKNKLI